MIDSNFSDESLAALLYVINSPALFTVCGSRFFGDAKDTSDYDFVTGPEFAAVDMLLASGWKKSKSDEAGYLDVNTIHILQRGKVQIMVCESVERRIKAREWIVAKGLDRHKTETWEKAYEAIA